MDSSRSEAAPLLVRVCCFLPGAWIPRVSVRRRNPMQRPVGALFPFDGSPRLSFADLRSSRSPRRPCRNRPGITVPKPAARIRRTRRFRGNLPVSKNCRHNSRAGETDSAGFGPLACRRTDAKDSLCPARQDLIHLRLVFSGSRHAGGKRRLRRTTCRPTCRRWACRRDPGNHKMTFHHKC